MNALFSARVIIVLLCIALIAGCAKASSQQDTSKTSTAVVGNLDEGRQIFSNNCATCHGATGKEGGVGPSLANERKRKSYNATIAWIKKPQAPMPTLYPSPLDDAQVNDVAAYVQSL